MGDIGDYWREHKDYEDRQRRKRLGLKPYVPEKRNKPKDRIVCKCGKTMPDAGAYINHKRSKGRKGHEFYTTR